MLFPNIKLGSSSFSLLTFHEIVVVRNQFCQTEKERIEGAFPKRLTDWFYTLSFHNTFTHRIHNTYNNTYKFKKTSTTYLHYNRGSFLDQGELSMTKWDV